MGRTVQIFDAAVGGAPIGHFTGAVTPLWVAHLPADPRAQRARVATSIGEGEATVRIEGWVQASSIPMFAARDIPLVAGHVAVARSHRLDVLRVAPDGLEVQVNVAGTQGQVVRGKAPCDAIAVSPSTFDAPTPGGKHWITRGGSIDLLDRPNGDLVFTLRLDPSAVQAFWSSEQRGPFLRVESRTDLVLNGWARVGDLVAVPAGEIRARYVPPQAPTVSIVRLPDNPPLARVVRETTVHADAERAAPVIGAVEPGAEVYVLATIMDYVSVLPKNLGVMAPERKGFWIAARDLVR